MSRRIVSLLVAVFMLITVFAGCGASKVSDGNTSSAVSEKSSETSKVEEKKPVELTMWVASKNEDDFTKAQDEKFKTMYPNITINKVVHEGDPGNDFLQGVAAGNAPDFVECSYANVIKYSAAGVIAPMDSYFGSWADASKWDKKYVDQYTLKGKLMALPTQGTTYYLAYNKKLFQEAGIAAPPKTWAEMLEDAKKLTKPEKQQWGYNMLIAEWSEWFFQYYVWQAGGDLTKKNDDGTMTLTFTDPAVAEAAKFYQDLYKAKAIQSDVTMKFEPLVKAFAAGKVGMMMFATDWVNWAASLGMKAEDIGLAAPPVGPASKPYVFGGIGGGYVMNAKSTKEKQDAAWAYISFRSTKDYYTEWYKEQAKKGPIGPYYNAITDFDLSKVVTLDPEWIKITNDMKPFMRDEFYGKGVVGKYVDKAVQKIAIGGGDPEKELKAAQDQATKEVLNDFNTKVKAGN